MKLWLRKSLIILVSILTFGAVTPSHFVWFGNQNLPDTKYRGETDEPSHDASVNTEFKIGNELSPIEEHVDHDTFVKLMTDEAERQAFIKFGPKISNVIENEFKEIILPNIEEAIKMTAAQFQDETLENFAITEKPGGGVSEKIFHIYNIDSNQDVIRFHVRRDKPPQEGYKFNFHYHTYHDGFQTHYTLGTIAWSKNTPPKWQTV